MKWYQTTPKFLENASIFLGVSVIGLCILIEECLK